MTTSSFKYDAPSKADWSDGLKYVVCYSAHTLPPAPPPFDPGKPASTMVVPTGSVPFGTDVTVTGIATDDDAVVSPLTATVRNSAGLYLQDNGTISATANTYPVSLASGAYGTASVGWSMVFNNNLPIGTYTVALTVKDSDNKTAVVSKSFGVSSAADTVKPVATITGPGASIFTTTNFIINGTVTDNVGVETISVRLTNAAGNFLQDNLTSFTSTPNDLNVTIGGLHTSSADFGIDTGDRAAGAYTVIVNATDAAGNAATQKTKVVTVTTLRRVRTRSSTR